MMPALNKNNSGMSHSGVLDTMLHRPFDPLLCSREADNAGGKGAFKRPLHRLSRSPTRGACFSHPLTLSRRHILCKYRTTYLYVTSPSSMSHVERHDAGMALHTSWSRWHGIRGWFISLPDSASRRISLPTAFSNDAYPKRTVRVEHQGKSPAIAYEIGH